MINKIKNLISDSVDDFVITKTQSTSYQNKFANNNIVVNKNWNQESYDLFISVKDKDSFKVGNTDININLDLQK